MKWIYAELRNVNDHPLFSYRINPNYIMAIDLNERKLIIKDFSHPLYYNKEDDNLILKLMSTKLEIIFSSLDLFVFLFSSSVSFSSGLS